MNSKITTLDRFLVQQKNKHPRASGELARVIEQLGLVGKIISGYMAAPPWKDCWV